LESTKLELPKSGRFADLTKIVPIDSFFVPTLFDYRTKLINCGNIVDAKNEFTALTNNIELARFIDNIITDNEIAKLLISKYIWYLQSIVNNDVIAQTLHFDIATLEHIIPQKPDENTNWLTDFSPEFRREYTYKLGNMTLLNQALNSSAKNYDFSIKKEKYKETNLSFTTDIIKETISEEFIKQRHKKIIKGIYNDLNIESGIYYELNMTNKGFVLSPDQTKIEFDFGGFDNWCVFLTRPKQLRYAPKDAEYFRILQDLGKIYGALKIYSDFVKFYDLTTSKAEQTTLDLIVKLSKEYKDHKSEICIWFTVLYAGMIAEENKQNAILKKRIKRLGLHQVLIEGFEPAIAANFSRGKKWRELDALCKEKGF